MRIFIKANVNKSGDLKFDLYNIKTTGYKVQLLSFQLWFGFTMSSVQSKWIFFKKGCMANK